MTHEKFGKVEGCPKKSLQQQWSVVRAAVNEYSILHGCAATLEVVDDTAAKSGALSTEVKIQPKSNARDGRYILPGDKGCEKEMETGGEAYRYGAEYHDEAGTYRSWR